MNGESDGQGSDPVGGRSCGPARVVDRSHDGLVLDGVPPMTPETAAAAYGLLVIHAGANEDEQDAFVLHLAGGCAEWRFQGWLGFGGKLYVERDRWRVSCYPEDLTAGRRRIIDVTNAALRTLRQEVTL